MSMIKWNEYRQQLSAGIAEIAKSSPDIGGHGERRRSAHLLDTHPRRPSLPSSR
jgi:hypothetical protein